ncbi:cis-prenyltransferase 4, chloroplastic-like [Lycium ferocissimum]|uniref:cis-prenyltransferase 4, chloroplastic-like n=1 Tax=Lycium ferocissimum TaxID=112874 RepID=UPI0028159737|nr:cis-prenyltransferase 4, chloroplastic-like [Lycium ferocissimum]
MVFLLQLQQSQIFLSPTRLISSQPKPIISNPLISLNVTTKPSIHPPVNAAISNITSEAKEVLLPAPLRRELMPKHVAVIMDGNRRWAKMRGLPVALGYEAGIRAVRKLLELCGNWGISVLTVFAFSSENWSRPKVEVDLLMGLFERGLKNELEDFARAGIRISIIGDSSKLPKSLQDLIDKTVKTTEGNSRLHLVLALNYSGQHDVVQACQTIAQKAKDGIIEPEDINRLLVEQELQTNCIDFPCPDLLIRTSGELRLSNFLLWQLAYAELFFSHSHWPDFGEAEFLEALCSFQQRQRRYGGQSS